MTAAWVSTAELAGGDGQSEDRVFAASNSVVVLDGVSTLEAGGDPSGWYPDALGHRLADLLAANPRDDLREMLAEAIADVATKHGLQPQSAPASTVAIVRWGGGFLEGLVLADSPIMVFGNDGGIDILRDGRHETVVAELRRDAARLDGLRGRDGDELKALIRATRPAKLARMNQPGGYWIAETTPEAGCHAIVRRWPIETVSAVLAVTDGVSAVIDDYRVLPSWSAALNLARREGLDGLLQTIHQAEARDPHARRWPPKPTTTRPPPSSTSRRHCCDRQAAQALGRWSGDTQGIELYAQRGYAIPQPMPDGVRQAYQRLVDLGYTNRLVA